MEAACTVEYSPSLAAEGSRTEKLVRAARQFEAVLLNQLFGSLERTFSVLGDEKTETGSDHYRFLGMQALASSVAAKGGLGIADMIIRNLKQRENLGAVGDPKAIKKPL